MAVHIGLLLLMRYDDTVKIKTTTNDAVMPHSPLRFLSNVLLLKKYKIKNGLVVKCNMYFRSTAYSFIQIRNLMEDQKFGPAFFYHQS